MIKWLLLAALTLASPASPSVFENPVDWRTAQRWAKACYETKHGIKVEAYRVNCPPQQWLEEETARFMVRLGVPKGKLKGMRFVATGPMLAGKIRILGIQYEGLTMAQWNWNEWHAMNTTMHEFGHYVLDRAGLDPDGSAFHYARTSEGCTKEGWIGYGEWECELLMAATALGVNQPLLSEDNPYRKVIEEM